MSGFSLEKKMSRALSKGGLELKHNVTEIIPPIPPPILRKRRIQQILLDGYLYQRDYFSPPSVQILEQKGDENHSSATTLSDFPDHF